MTYATQQDLIDRFGERELIQRTDRTNRPATTVDATVVTRHLTDATATVDGYLAKKYTLPLASTPEILVKITADIARYFLHGNTAEKGDPVRDAYDQAVGWLRDVSKGHVVLEDGGEAAAQPGGGSVSFTAPDRVMSRDSLKGM
ncbi:MAG: DUF1320 domain-containing protein [Pseudomonadota bacterium]